MRPWGRRRCLEWMGQHRCERPRHHDGEHYASFRDGAGYFDPAGRIQQTSSGWVSWGHPWRQGS
jgi:hypothetical protein